MTRLGGRELTAHHFGFPEPRQRVAVLYLIRSDWRSSFVTVVNGARVSVAVRRDQPRVCKRRRVRRFCCGRREDFGGFEGSSVDVVDAVKMGSSRRSIRSVVGYLYLTAYRKGERTWCDAWLCDVDDQERVTNCSPVRRRHRACSTVRSSVRPILRHVR